LMTLTTGLQSPSDAGRYDDPRGGRFLTKRFRSR
jgi:hypothetical protein